MTDGWRTLRIGEWGQVKGGRQRSPRLTDGKDRPYLRVANVLDGVIDTSDVLEMRFTDAEFTQYAVQPGDILLNEGQSSELVGRSAIYDGPLSKYAFQNTLVRFRPGPECDPIFAHEVFRHLWRQGAFKAISKRTTSIAHLGVTRFAALRVRVPSLVGQQLIAGLLRRFDAVVDQVDALVAGKRALKRGLMQELLTGKRRFPEFTGQVRRVRLGDYTSELSRRNAAGLGADRVMGVIKGVGLEPMRDHVRAANLSRYKIVPPAAFAYNPMRINIGSIAHSHLSKDCLVSPDYVVFEADADELLPSFLDQIRHSRLWTTFVRPAGSGSVRVRIYFRDLAELRIPLPSIAEQRRIAGTLDAIDREIALLTRMREAHEIQKSGLMRRFLAGGITVEPESAVA